MKLLHLKPLGENVLVQTGSTLLSTLVKQQLNIKMSCGGRGICSTCRVSVREGMNQLSTVQPRERKTLSLVVGVTPECRLSCQARIEGDGIIVEVPKGMYIERMSDLTSMLGKRAPENILHPIHGHVLIAKDKIITRSLLEQSRLLEAEVGQMRNRVLGAGESDSQHNSKFSKNFKFMATGSGLAPAQVSEFSAFQTISNLNTKMEHSQHLTKSVQLQENQAHRPPTVIENRPNPDQETVSQTSNWESNLSKLEAGMTIDKFLLLEEIGKGGAGVVYRALHTKLRSTVAMKFLRPTSPAAMKMLFLRFGNEARLLAQLNHPNIVRVLDFEDNEFQPYVVMEFVDGSSAYELLKAEGRLRLQHALSIVTQVTKGLMAALKLGIIHRDVKPANILVDNYGTAKLVDLGLAVQLHNEETVETGLPYNGDGTAAYMAPEQRKGNVGTDHRADIYSLGVTFYHLLTGRLPFTGGNRNEVLLKHTTVTPPAPHELHPDIPIEVSKTILKMMAKQPVSRPQRYEEVLTLLEKLGSPALEAASASS